MSDVHGHTMQVSRLLHLLYILSLIYPYNPMESGGAFADAVIRLRCRNSADFEILCCPDLCSRQLTIPLNIRIMEPLIVSAEPVAAEAADKVPCGMSGIIYTP